MYHITKLLGIIYGGIILRKFTLTIVSFLLQRLSEVTAMQITHENVRSLATFIHSSASIKDRVIRFGSGTASEKLIEVPLGRQCGAKAIILTLGIDKSYPNSRDSDLHIGISDGKVDYKYATVDVHNYNNHSPCFPRNAVHDNRRVSRSTKAPSTLKFMFDPHSGYTYCETVQEGGFINSGTFKSNLDPSQPLFLRLYRGGSAEHYSIHYVSVEIY